MSPKTTKKWKELIRDFWKDFIPTVENCRKRSLRSQNHDRYRLPQLRPQTPKDLVPQQIFLRLLQLPRLRHSQPPSKRSNSKKKTTTLTSIGTNPAPRARPNDPPPRQIRPLPRMLPLSRMQRHRQHPQKRRASPQKICLPAPPSAATATWPTADPALAKHFSPAQTSPIATSSSMISTILPPNTPTIPKPPTSKSQANGVQKKGTKRERKEKPAKTKKAAPKQRAYPLSPDLQAIVGASRTLPPRSHQKTLGVHQSQQLPRPQKQAPHHPRRKTCQSFRQRARRHAKTLRPCQ